MIDNEPPMYVEYLNPMQEESRTFNVASLHTSLIIIAMEFRFDVKSLEYLMGTLGNPDSIPGEQISEQPTRV